MSRLRAVVPDRSDDSGFTLVELLVAMGIFTILLAIFSTSVAAFSRTTVRTVRISDQSTQSRTVFDLFDKQLRSASAVNRPALVGTNWYVEYRTDAVTPSQCTQWVLYTATDTLAFRTWITGVTTVSTPTGWRTVATDVSNSITQPPFAFAPSTTTIPLQRLTVSLRYQQGTGPVTTSTSVFAARNSSTSTVTNPDVNNDGLSDTQVCQDITGVRL